MNSCHLRQPASWPASSQQPRISSQIAPLASPRIRTAHGRETHVSHAHAATQHITGLSQLAPKYDAILLDQFGVLHDGQAPYGPATVRAVRQLVEAGLRVFIISNSSRRSSGTLQKLTKLGFDESWFAGAVTSGDMAHEHLLARPSPWWQALGTRCLHLTWGSRGTISLQGLGLQVTASPSEADFILAHGTQAVGQPDGGVAVDTSLEEMRGLLRECAVRGLPMIVANPDLVTVDGAKLAVMPGTLAKWYREDMVGKVVLMGKPAAVIYEAAMCELGVDARRVLAVGDSMEHDIAGAAAAGIDSLFIAGGIHAEELEVARAGQSTESALYSAEALKSLSLRFGVEPTYSMGYLEW